MTRAVVIGAGAAGLTAAASLAREGCEVALFEQADHIGGVTSTIRRQGFAWDVGPMALEGFGPGEPAARVLQQLGCYDQIQLVRGDRGLYFPDFEVSRPDRYAGPLWRREKLKEIFPHQADRIDRFYEFLGTSIDLITLERHSVIADFPRSLPLKLGMLLLFSRVKKYAEWNAMQLMDHFFTDPKLKSFFLMILADMTILPEEYPALGIPFSNQEAAYDRRIPPKRALGIGPKSITYQFIAGGCGSLVDALVSVIRANGGEVHAGKAVTSISIEKDRVTGVTLDDGTRAEADLVLASGDARHCFFELIGREKLPQTLAAAIDDIPLMESILMVHLGVDMDPTPYQDVPLNYYYGQYDVEEGVRRTRNGIFHEGKAGFLIYIPSLHSPSMAPEGKHAITVYTIAPNVIQGDWTLDKEKLTDRLLAEAEKIIPGLRAHASVSLTLTPREFGEMTHMRKHHSFGGYCPMQGRSGAPHRTPFKGLWFIGSQSETGPGVWTQLMSSRNVCKTLSKEI
jgi:prolycopene isomerase